MRNINLVDLDFKRDIQEISTYIQNYVDETYLSQIRNQIEVHKSRWARTPVAEVQLLEAMIPFVHQEAGEKLSQMVKMITYSKIIEAMLPDYGLDSEHLRSENKIGSPNDYIHRAIMSLVLYKIIVWAEENSSN